MTGLHAIVISDRDGVPIIKGNFETNILNYRMSKNKTTLNTCNYHIPRDKNSVCETIYLY